ncbi:MAG: DUF1593 domain-containing protein [Planctomycetes bacterium]|nr:DUF1593 domain-containing protein [Planctomycetota bacterium]
MTDITFADGGKDMSRGVVNGYRYRTLISSDVGGFDDDDYQSFVHYMVYSDMFDTEGVIASPPGPGNIDQLHTVWDLYEADYPALKKHSIKYPSPQYMRSITKQGAQTPYFYGPAYTDKEKTYSYPQPSEGARWLIKCALRPDMEKRPLYVLVWGCPTDLAYALRAEPRIKKNIRVLYLSGWNEQQDPTSYQYIEENHKDLWVIQDSYGFNGLRFGGNQEGDLGNFSFMQTHVRGHGSMGDYISLLKSGKVKMGDTPTVLYLLKGTPEDPTRPSWGGRFEKRGEGYPNWFVNLKDPAFMVERNVYYNSKWWGAKTVSRWREEWLRDWQYRMDRVIAPPQKEN